MTLIINSILFTLLTQLTLGFRVEEKVSYCYTNTMLKPIDIESICGLKMNSSGKDVDFKINEFLRKRNNKNPSLRTFEN